MVFGAALSPHAPPDDGDSVQSKCPPMTSVPWYQVMAWPEPDVSVLKLWWPVVKS